MSACGSSSVTTTPSVSSSNVASPTASPSNIASCADVASALELSWGQSQGAAGTEYRVIQVKNISSVPCEIQGSPEVKLFNGDAVTLAEVAAPVNAQPSLTIGPDATLDISIGTANPDNFPAKDCQAAKATKAVVTKLTGATDTWEYGLDVPQSESPWNFCTTAGNTPFFASYELEIN